MCNHIHLVAENIIKYQYSPGLQLIYMEKNIKVCLVDLENRWCLLNITFEKGSLSFFFISPNTGGKNQAVGGV